MASRSVAAGIQQIFPTQSNLTEEILYNYKIRGGLMYPAEACHLIVDKPKEEDELLFKTANKVTTENVGENVNLRAIIEFSNICEADCKYCGIRNSNKSMERYRLDRKTVVDTAMQAVHQYPGLLFQSGEVHSDANVDWLCSIIKEVKETAARESPLGKNFRIIVSIGELTDDQYARLKAAGADRYLLRIETTSPELFSQIHTETSSFYNRQRCLRVLQALNFHVGTGILIGLPNQKPYDLVRDVFYFKRFGADMIGMGPYLPAKGTPMAETYDIKEVCSSLHSENLFDTVKRMISITRLNNPRSNVSATTAMEALAPVNGRAEAIFCGANVVMPVLTPVEKKKIYYLYEGKSNVKSSLDMLEKQIHLAGRTMNLRVNGDPKTWEARQEQKNQ